MIRKTEMDLFASQLDRIWLLVMMIPLLLAAGLLEERAGDHGLPDDGSYRSPLSSTLLGGSHWRIPQDDPAQSRWRESPPPPVGWRSLKQQAEAPSSKRSLELFPPYTPGKTSDYDFISREEKPLIKVFEFGR